MKTSTITQTSNHIRRKQLKETLQKSNEVKTPKEFRLNGNDYGDLIDIKRTRDRNQRERSTLFFLVGLCFALGSMIIIFNWNFYDDQQTISLGEMDEDRFEEIQEIPPTEQPPPPPPMVVQAPIIVEVSDEIILEEVDVNLDVEATEEMIVEEIEFTHIIEEEVAEEIFEIVENQPEPVGGYKAFYSYVGESLKYPRTALNLHISGRVFVRFVVDSEGKISQVHVVKGIGAGCDAEAIRVLENAPAWNPGKQRGRPVSVWMTLPITFKLVD